MAVVTHNEIINAIVLAENVAYLNAQARANALRNGETPCEADNAKAIEIEQWITILQRAEAQVENECITSDDVWQLIQKINEQYRGVDCDVSRTFSRRSSSGGGSNFPSGYVERVLGVNVDNSNPSRPVIRLYVDGVTITGTGTQADPLEAVAGGGTVVSVNGLTGVVVLTTTNIAEGTNQYFTTARVLATALTGLSVTGGTVTSTDTVLQAFGKLQNQINSLVGGVIYQGTWNASTNTPTLTSSVGTKGFYYVVNVAGSTNLNGNTDWQIGDWAIFNGTVWEKVDNTDASIGNTVIQPITAAALLILQGANGLSTTTLYDVTDAPLVIRIGALSTSQLSQTGEIIDATYSGTVKYNLAANTFDNGSIYDADSNIWNGILPSQTTLGSGTKRNTFSQNIDKITIGDSSIGNIFLNSSQNNILGVGAISNIFKQDASGFTFGDNLLNVTIESNTTGADYTASPAYDFLYNKAYDSVIFQSRGINYHRYFDVANNRIVITDLATPANVTYIGGSSSSWASTEVTGNLTAALSTQYINTANATYTDPSPTQAKGYQVYVRNGTATIGGVGYSVAGSVIWRVYHSGAWATYLILDKTANDALYASKTFVESLSLQDGGTGIAATTYTLELYAAYAYTINELKIIADAGTCTAAVKINGTNVTGISAVSVSTVIATGTASAANTVAVGDKITLVTTSTSGLNNLQASLKTTRI